MSAECNECGFDIVYPPGTWPVGVCPNCTANDELDRLRDALLDILDITTGWTGLSGMKAREKLQAIERIARAAFPKSGETNDR